MKKITYRYNIFLPVLFLLSLIGLFSIDRVRFIPATPILEIMFFTGTILLIKHIEKKALILAIFSLLYIEYSSFRAFVYMETNVLDFIQAYKAFIYIIFLAFAIDKKLFTIKFITKLFNILLIFVAIKYSYSVLFGYDNRPILFTENNYELFFLLLIFYLKYIMSNYKFNLNEFVLIAYVFVISGSRSALAALVFVYAMISIKKIDLKFLLNFFILIILLYLFVLIFMERLHNNNLESIDRFRFLTYFLLETNQWDWWRWLIGAPPLTPLHQSTCNALSFYSTLLSHKHDGSCYSVILHSYILRVIFDHGIVGLLFIIYFINYGLKKANFFLKERITFIIVIIMNGLSVSSINNVYIALPVFFYFAVKRKDDYSKQLQVNTIEKNNYV